LIDGRIAPRRSVAEDIEAQGGMPAPRMNIAAQVVIVIAVVALLVWWLMA
jgi:hypothetical protein